MKGLHTLVGAREEREDGLKDEFESIITEMLQTSKSLLQLHKGCRRDYTEQKHIQRYRPSQEKESKDNTRHRSIAC